MRLTKRGAPPLPNFLIIGAQKSATRWLRVNLGRHPDIFTAARELEFFDNRFDEGVDAYRRRFTGWDGEPYVGEATPGYMIWRKDCEAISARIEQTLPDVRLLAILRHPVDRAYSAFLHHMARGRIDPQADLLETIASVDPKDDRLSLISGGWYAASLEPYVRRFGDRLLVLLQEAIKDDGPGVYRRAVAHVGAPRGFEPDDLDSVLFSSDEKLPRDAARLDADGRRRPLSADERAALAPYFAEDIDRLEAMLGLDLSHWKQA